MARKVRFPRKARRNKLTTWQRYHLRQLAYAAMNAGVIHITNYFRRVYSAKRLLKMVEAMPEDVWLELERSNSPKDYASNRVLAVKKSGPKRRSRGRKR